MEHIPKIYIATREVTKFQSFSDNDNGGDDEDDDTGVNAASQKVFLLLNTPRRTLPM
jgi:hypothetical protein